MATGMHIFSPPDIESFFDDLKDEQTEFEDNVNALSQDLHRIFTFDGDTSHDLAQRILLDHQSQHISDHLSPNVGGDDPKYAQQQEDANKKIAEQKGRVKHFLMVEILTKPDNTYSRHDERVQRFAEADHFMQKLIKSFPRKHVQVDNYKQMLDEIEKFFVNNTKGNILPMVVFFGHGEAFTGRLCFAECKRVSLESVYDDVLGLFRGRKEATFPDSALRLIFAECWAHKVFDGTKDGEVNVKDGIEYVYFTNSCSPTTTSLVSEEERSTDEILPVNNTVDIQFAISPSHPYMTLCRNRLLKPFREVWGQIKYEESYCQALMLGDEVDLLVTKGKEDKYASLMSTVHFYRQGLKAYLQIVCSSGTSLQRKKLIEESKKFMEADLYCKNVQAATFQAVSDAVVDFLTNGGRLKHVPIVLICAEGERGTDGHLEKILINSEAKPMKDIYSTLRTVFNQNRGGIAADSLRVAFFCHESAQDQTDSAAQAPSNLLYATNSLPMRTKDSKIEELMEDPAEVTGPGPLND